ncbi:MAG: hypothetical protein CSA75_04050 [Sorangium cellulosum]|nr:MAG: hypothetical protein CSA75_04050 [Sorangium cellulosum]
MKVAKFDYASVWVFRQVAMQAALELGRKSVPQVAPAPLEQLVPTPPSVPLRAWLIVSAIEETSEKISARLHQRAIHT